MPSLHDMTCHVVPGAHTRTWTRTWSACGPAAHIMPDTQSRSKVVRGAETLRQRAQAGILPLQWQIAAAGTSKCWVGSWKRRRGLSLLHKGRIRSWNLVGRRRSAGQSVPGAVKTSRGSVAPRDDQQCTLGSINKGLMCEDLVVRERERALYRYTGCPRSI